MSAGPQIAIIQDDKTFRVLLAGLLRLLDHPECYSFAGSIRSK